MSPFMAWHVGVISHSEHLVRNEFTGDIFFKHQFSLIIHKLFFKTNKINIFITKSLRIFFCGPWNFLYVFFDLHQEKVLHYAQFKMYFS